MLGEHAVEFGGGIGSGGRPRLPIRLMASLLYLKNSFNLSDEELVARWSENVVWQFFSDMECYEPRLPCDATQIGRFRTVIGEEGLEQLLKFTIQTAVEIKAIRPAELERVIVDSTVQDSASTSSFRTTTRNPSRSAGPLLPIRFSRSFIDFAHVSAGQDTNYCRLEWNLHGRLPRLNAGPIHGSERRGLNTPRLTKRSKRVSMAAAPGGMARGA
jgi:hypothetical protein